MLELERNQEAKDVVTITITRSEFMEIGMKAADVLTQELDEAAKAKGMERSGAMGLQDMLLGMALTCNMCDIIFGKKEEEK